MSDADDRMGAMAVLVACLGHELRNVLAAADSSLYLAERARDEASRATQIAAARASVRTAQDLVGRALLPAHDQARAFEPLSVVTLLEAAARAARTDPAVTVEVDVDPPELALDGDPLLLGRALENLVDNARLVAASAARAMVTIRLIGRADADGVRLVVEDDGPGIAPEVRDRLFEPLVTARPDGTGLGLAFVRAVARLHGGEVTGGAGEAGGARFALVLPSPPTAH